MAKLDSTMSASEEVRDLLHIVIRQPRKLPGLSNQQIDMSLRVARRARLLGRLGCRLDDVTVMERLPQIVIDQLQGAMAMAQARVRLAVWELDRIAWALGEDTSTPLVVMKGCAYILLDLPNAPGRLFADVDLMTHESDLHSVESVLNEMGWESSKLTAYDDNYYRKWTHELPPLTHVEREVEIDLHHNLLPRTARLKPDGKTILARSRRLPGSRYRVMADEDIVLHAMAHLMYDSDLADKLRDLVDIADLVEHFSSVDDAFWERLTQRAAVLDLRRPTYYSLRYAKRLLDAAVPHETTREMAAWAPPGFIVLLMDRLVPRSLYPQHPDHPSRLSEVARFLLYVRSHWLRMPPWLLAYHLTVKFVRRRIRPG